MQQFVFLTALIAAYFPIFILLNKLLKTKMLLVKSKEDSNSLQHDNFKLISELAAVKSEQKTVKSIEAQQILHDMTAHGCAIVKITPISPNDVFLRSPR